MNDGEMPARNAPIPPMRKEALRLAKCTPAHIFNGIGCKTNGDELRTQGDGQVSVERLALLGDHGSAGR